MLLLSTIPSLDLRLKCWSFKLEATEIFQSIQSPIDTLASAIREVRSSTSLRAVLGAVLALGNYMNGGSEKGQADGFNIEVLNKISLVKDNQNKKTLLEYVVNIVRKTNGPEIAGKLPADLTQLEAAARIASVDDSNKELTQLQTELKNVVKHIEMLNKIQDESVQSFLTMMNPVILQVSAKVETLQQMHSQLSSDWFDMLSFFGVSSAKSKSVDPPSFFGALKEFIAAYQKQFDAIEKSNAPQPSNPAMRGKSRPGGPQKVGEGADPLAVLANAIRLGVQPLKKTTSAPKTQPPK